MLTRVITALRPRKFEMTEENVKKLFRQCDSMRLALVATLFLLFVLAAVNARAVPMQSLDATGDAVELSVEVEKDPDSFIDLMKQEFARGNIDSAGYFAEQLVPLRPQEADVHAIYSISLAATGKNAEAREQLNAAKRLGPDTLFTLAAEAIILQREKNYTEAIKKCEQAIALNATHPYPRNILGRVYADMGHHAKALDCFQKAVELKVDFLLGYINLGAVSYLTGDYERSIASFSKAIELNRNAYAAHYGLGVVYETLGKNKEAMQALQKSLELRPGNASALETLGKLQLKEGLIEAALQTGNEMASKNMDGAFVLLGDALLQAGKTDEAIASLKKAPQGGAEVPYLLGYCEMVQGRYEAAERLMEDVLKIDPRHFGAYSARTALKLYLGKPIDPKKELANQWDPAIGKLLHFTAGCLAATEKRWPDALKEFQSSEGMINGYSLAGIDPKTFTAGINEKEGRYLNLGVLYYFKRLFPQSLSEFSKAIEINPRSLLGNYWAAQVCLQKKDRAQAMQFFTSAVQEAPKFFAALYALGELHFMAGKVDAAADYYRQAVNVHKDPGLLIKLGLHAEQTGNNEDAAKYYQEVIDTFPAFFVGYNQLAWLYAKRGVELDTAMRLAQKADELQPGNASILDTIGWIHFQKKKFDAAASHLEKALESNPNNPTILYHLGRTLLAQGKSDAAMGHLRRALELSPKFEGAEDARKLLGKEQ